MYKRHGKVNQRWKIVYTDENKEGGAATYVGCYLDSGARRFPKNWGYKKTRAECFDLCRAAGFGLCALQNGGWCTGGNITLNPSDKRPDG